ncbi:MAG TPA: hypothetical protein VGC85_09275 [Chthoniobacterales bacterium]|jgi:hypothetical protein
MIARSIVSTFVALLLATSVATPTHAAEMVWSGLVMATNSPEPTPIPAELTKLEGTLKRLFGYNQFEVIGEKRTSLKTGDEDWLATSKYFSLHVDSKAAKKASYSLNLKLFQENNLLLETDAKLTKASPIVVKGPQVGDGQLVLLLMLE